MTTGAYGLRVEGIDGGAALRVDGGEDWPLVHVRQEVDPGPFPAGAGITEETAWVQTPAAHLTIDRVSSVIRVRAPAPVADTDLVHPCLWPAASVFARWRGAETLHGGAVVDGDGGAWAVIGAQGAGKSSLLAALALGGHEIVADDLLVIEGSGCFAGPRCVDLRPEAADLLGLRDRTTPVRSTQRRRLALPSTRARFELRGFVCLDWGPEIAVTKLSPGESLGLLAAHRRVSILGFSAEQMFDLAGLPTLRLARPQAWEQQDAVAAALMRAIGHERLGH